MAEVRTPAAASDVWQGTLVAVTRDTHGVWFGLLEDENGRRGIHILAEEPPPIRSGERKARLQFRRVRDCRSGQLTYGWVALA